MKNLLLSSFLAFFCMQITAQNQDQPGQMPQVSPAQTLHPEFVQFKEIEYDFGNIKQNVPPSHTFTFKNVGDRDIILTNVQASCGCTTPNWKGGAYKPGESGEIIATYNAASEGGFNKVITVTTSEGVVILTIKGNVLNPAAYELWKHQQDSINAAKEPIKKVNADKKAKKEKPAKKAKKEKPNTEGDKPKKSASK